jgi:hypothetical protein
MPVQAVHVDRSIRVSGPTAQGTFRATTGACEEQFMNGWEPSTVTRELTVQLVAPGDGSISLPVVLHYDLADPYAVHATFRTGQGDGVSWVFARELLTLGVHRPAGDGDVRVWPASATADVLFLHLRAPSGEALFELSRATLSAFLRETEVLVPAGSEAAALDLDDELAALLSNGGADPTGR